ncbi:histidine phosphatase family protein [Streptomyces sp. NPDC090493]|uniref:histidine phosphatase family protein n=1 Tax=Streptomyces sp. NPDC090493 TaxID=3365964 RepID=UPI0037F5D22E
MSIHLTLLCAPGGDATLDPRLGDAVLSERDLRLAGAAREVLSLRGRAVRAPSTRCSQTADAVGLSAAPEPMLRDLDVGGWRGRTVDEVAAADPAGFSAWLTDPDAAPHGGESVRGLCRRSADWLSSVAPGTGHMVVITEAAVVRAALIHALAMPARAFWHLSVPPLETVFLTWRGGWWDVQFGRVSARDPRRRLLPRPPARAAVGSDRPAVRPDDGTECRPSGAAPSWPVTQFLPQPSTGGTPGTLGGADRALRTSSHPLSA